MKPSLEKKLGKVTYNEQVIELSGGSDEWQPNPTWWDVKTILENDTREYVQKNIWLLKDDEEESVFAFSNASAYATSDGAFYEVGVNETVTHTWDKSQDKPCLIDGEEAYKTRYVIIYGTNTAGVSQQSTPQIFALYIAIKNATATQYMFDSQYLLQAVDGEFVGNNNSPGYLFRDCKSIKKYPKFNLNNIISSGSQIFYGNTNLTKPLELDYSKILSISEMYGNCINLKEYGNITLQANAVGTFRDCKNLTKFYDGDYSIVENMQNLYYGCEDIKDDFIGHDVSNVVSFNNTFAKTLIGKVSIDTSKAVNMQGVFENCYMLTETNEFDLSNATNIYGMFNACKRLKQIKVKNTHQSTNLGYFAYNCSSAKTISVLDMRNASYTYNMLNGCKKLENLTIKNIKIATQIGSSTSWGHLLTLDSLLNTIKELWDNTSGTKTLTLTVSTPSKTLLKNTYVKLVDITEEMRAEDEYIDNKKPFIVCESTDEGAMTAEEYVISKNWQLA